jgi:hypothetical protein
MVPLYTSARIFFQGQAVEATGIEPLHAGGMVLVAVPDSQQPSKLFDNPRAARRFFQPTIAVHFSGGLFNKDKYCAAGCAIRA